MRYLTAFATILLFAAQQPALVPAPVRDSALKVTVEPAGKMPVATNPTSPIVAGLSLILIDQAGALFKWDGAAASPLLSIKSPPSGIQPMGHEAIVNAASSADGGALFVVFTSATVPRNVPSRRSTRPGADAWHVFVRYDFNGSALSSPRAFAALQVRSDGHTGGGLAALADDTLLFATGDNGDSGEDGRSWAQDPSSHLGKILRIDPRDGSISVVASGIRNAQRMTVGPREGEPWVEFIDMGGSVSEEFNAIRVTDLLRAGAAVNFGWGRNAKDGKSREGTFYIDNAGAAQNVVPAGEAGFVAPVAQFGRETVKQFGTSGAVASDVSFRTIAALFGDLNAGVVLAVTGSRRTIGQPVLRVQLVDAALKETSLWNLAGQQRPDPRYFNFPDGSAGVLLEKTGEFFRLTERTNVAATGEPAVARDGFLDSGGVRIHYVEQGNGPAVVLLHELDASVRSWMDAGVFARLANDFRVVAIDLRGHGLSGKPHEPAQYGVELGRDVVRLMDHLKIPQAHLVGYSFGSEVAMMAIANYPDRFVSAAFGAGVGRLRWKSTDQQHLEEEALEFQSTGVSPKLFLEQVQDGTPDPTEAQLRALAAIALADPGRDRQALAALSRARRSRLVSPETIAATKLPILAIAGSLDPELSEVEVLKKLRPDVTLKVIEGATHNGPARALDRPEFLAAILGFLMR